MVEKPVVSSFFIGDDDIPSNKDRPVCPITEPEDHMLSQLRYQNATAIDGAMRCEDLKTSLEYIGMQKV